MLLNVIFTLILIAVTVVSSGQATVKGILYTDGRPVSVTIAEGKITGIKKQKNFRKGTGSFTLHPDSLITRLMDLPEYHSLSEAVN